ncbi:MAG: CDP-alcohol phosphatidyltransferase family protein [Ferrovibrionaceae bacterium]
MLDPWSRRLIDPPLNAIGARLARAGLGADAVTLVGLVIGLGAVPALAFGQFWLALGLILANRLADGLDGAIARAAGASDRGGYLDIVADFAFYGLIPFGFALADPVRNALPAAFVLASFMGTASSFLAFAALAAKRGLTTTRRGQKSFYHLGGLAEGSETILFLVAGCLFPAWFPWLAWGFGTLCWLTTLGRVAAGWRDLA